MNESTFREYIIACEILKIMNEDKDLNEKHHLGFGDYVNSVSHIRDIIVKKLKINNLEEICQQKQI